MFVNDPDAIAYSPNVPGKVAYILMQESDGRCYAYTPPTGTELLLGVTKKQYELKQKYKNEIQLFTEDTSSTICVLQKKDNNIEVVRNFSHGWYFLRQQYEKLTIEYVLLTLFVAGIFFSTYHKLIYLKEIIHK